MATHTVGKPKPGLCAIYPTTGLLHCSMQMDMIAINNYFVAGEPQADHSNLLFEWQAMQAQWWDDQGILPSHPTVPPLHHISDITLPTLHRMKGLTWYRGVAEPPPPFIPPDGSSVHRDILAAEDCKTTRGRVEKIWAGGNQVPQHFDPVFNVKPVEEQRKDPTLHQRYMSKPTKTSGMASTLIKEFISSINDRVPDPFEDLFDMPCSIIVSGAESGDQLPHTDVSTAPDMPPPPP